MIHRVCRNFVREPTKLLNEIPTTGGYDGEFRADHDAAIMAAYDMPAHGIDPVTPARAGDGGKTAFAWYQTHSSFTNYRIS